MRMTYLPDEGWIKGGQSQKSKTGSQREAKPLLYNLPLPLLGEGDKGNRVNPLKIRVVRLDK